VKETFFFELSGEHPTMPSAEARKCAESEAGESIPLISGPGYCILPFSREHFNGVSERVALTHHIGKHLGSFDPSDMDLSGISIPDGSFAIRAKRFQGMMKNVDSQDLTRKLGTHLSLKNDVDLKDPEIVVRILMSDKVHIFISEKDIERDLLEKRKVGERPFFSPISLHPKYARAAVNLTGVKRNGVVLDPFCGTGGILIEAAYMGMKVIASDFDEEMIAGCIENMDHYGLKLHDHGAMDIGNIGDHFSNIDAVVTDPPYGRSTRTGGENIGSIYKRAAESIPKVLNPSGTACMVLPDPFEHPSLALQEMYVQKVHGSLFRHYHIFKPA